MSQLNANGTQFHDTKNSANKACSNSEDKSGWKWRCYYETIGDWGFPEVKRSG